MLAATILTIALVSLMRATMQSTNSTRETQKYTRAVMLTQQKIWELESTYRSLDEEGFEEEEDGNFAPPFDDFSWETEVEIDEERLVYILTARTLWIHGPAEKDKSNRQYTLMTECPMPGDRVIR